MIKEKNQPKLHLKENLVIREVFVNEVRVDPQERVRQEFGDFREGPTYIALKNSIIKFGLRNPISLNKNMQLVEGFYRLCIVTELGWERILAMIGKLTKKEAFELELEENFCRIPFNDYATYTGLARLKKLHEIDFPESKRGKYFRNIDRDNNIIKKTIIPSDGNMILSNNQHSFVDQYHNILGLKKTAIYDKARIGEAILSGKFSFKTIKAIKAEKITQTQLLRKLSQLDFNSSKRIQKTNKKITKENQIKIENNGKLGEQIKTTNKSESATGVCLDKVNKDTSLPAENQEEKYIKSDDSKGADRVDNKKSSFLEDLPIDKIDSPNPKSKINDNKLSKNKKKIESNTKETLLTCPHCKKGLILLKDSSKGEGIAILLPINLEKLH